LRLLSFSPSARSASSASRVALQSRSHSLSLTERTEKPRFGGLFLLRNGHRPVRKSCLSGLFPGARTDQDGPQWVKCGRQMRPRTDFAPSPANPVGPLPLPIGRPRPWPARSAIRRLRPSPSRKLWPFREGLADGQSRPEARLPLRSGTDGKAPKSGHPVFASQHSNATLW
jgi:hypothetical protein